MGKTTLMKKISWDWAKRIFTQFSIVFFIFLKLVEPGEPIENIIIKQIPELEGMSVNSKKLKQILEIHSSRCLLILDGLDEHALGQNEDVLKIIRGQKLLYCNIIVTARAHSTKEIERYFGMVVRSNGFNRKQAEKFASSILVDRCKVAAVLQYSPSGWEYLYVCPIIFLIVCVLVKNEAIVLGSKTFCNGELYFKLVRFLYVKYTKQKGMEYEKEHLVELIKKLGKLAWETLKSGNGLLRRSHVIKEIGEEAFEYGLLIGNEDFNLVGHDIADILVTFPHRILQEFLGSYYFVLRLGEGCSLESLLGSDCKAARFMQDQLFLHFCLWFVKGNEELIPVSKGHVALQALKSYVLEGIDVVQFEPEVIARMFPACDVNIAHKRRDTLVLTFLKDVFSELSRLKHLMLKDHDSIEYILDSVDSKTLNCLSSVVVEDMNSVITKQLTDRLGKSDVSKKSWLEYYLSQHFDGNLDIVIGGKICSEMFDRIVKYFRNLERPLSVYLFVDTTETLELTSFVDNSIQKLVLTDCFAGRISCKLEIPKCPHLSIANQTGKLPNLTHLSFEDCRHGFHSKSWPRSYHNVPVGPLFFPSLLQSRWPLLSCLNLCECYLKVEDFQDLSAANDKDFFSEPQIPASL